MEDWLKCRISPLIKYHQNQKKKSSWTCLVTSKVFEMSKQHEILFYHMLIYEEIAKQTLNINIMNTLYKVDEVISWVILQKNLIYIDRIWVVV